MSVPGADGVVDVPVESLDWHEQVQPLRLASVMESVQEVGVREPVRVTPRGDRYMILDGAHRARSAQALGLRTLPCRLLELADDAPVDGWTHAIAGRVELSSSSGTGDLVARIHDAHGTRDLYAERPGDGSYLHTMHAVGRLYRELSYERVSAPDLITERTTRMTQVEWVLPEWGRICRMAVDFGLLLPGVTRLGRYLD